MHISQKRRSETINKSLLVVFCIIALCSLLAIPLLLHRAPAPAQESTPTPTPTETPSPSDLQSAVTKAIDFFEEHKDYPDDPYALLLLDVVHRRFGIAEFADALQYYDQVMAMSQDKAPLMRLFRRIADHDNPLQAWDLEAVSEDVDYLTIPALYCDQLGLPSDYQSMLKHAMDVGDYMLTHALLACIWIQENGCEVPLPDGFIENIYSANAALINDDAVVDDFELEAATFLYLAGQGALERAWRWNG